MRLYDRMSPRLIARYAFLAVALALALLGVVIRNEWNTFMVIVSMTIAGLGEGALVTVLFNVLVTASGLGGLIFLLFFISQFHCPFYVYKPGNDLSCKSG